MKIVNSIEQINSLNLGPKGLVIGNFDGVHLGHKHLISTFLQKCQDQSITPVLLTLNPHPIVFFKGSECRTLLAGRDTKLSLLEQAGLNHIIEIPFTLNIQSMNANFFIKNYLLAIEELNLIFLGHDFALGSGKEDASELLLKLAPKNLFIEQIDTFKLDREICSSTTIRDQLRNGEVKKASRFLGYSFFIDGVVKKGLGNGSKYLVPTANIDFDHSRVYPAPGVYYTDTLIQNKMYTSITNIGINPTIGDKNHLNIESHILDFNKNLYREKIRISFLEKCRDEFKFNSVADLKSEILKNIEQRRSFRC